MGFTIAGIRDSHTGPRRRVRTTADTPPAADTVTAVTRYAARYGWDAVPGARATRRAGALVCSCGVADCLLPGSHPLRHAGSVPAGSGAREVEEVWSRHPEAAVLLPVGAAFDVLDVPEAVGRAALARMERLALPPGPVLLTPAGRAQFLVAPGAADSLPGLLYRTGWDGAELDLRPLGAGDHVTAPPSEVDGLGPVRWLRPPTPQTARRPPQARLLLGTLAYLCHVGPTGGGQWADTRWDLRALSGVGR